MLEFTSLEFIEHIWTAGVSNNDIFKETKFQWNEHSSMIDSQIWCSIFTTRRQEFSKSIPAQLFRCTECD